MNKIFCVIILFKFNYALAIERCNFELDQKFFQIELSYHVNDLRNERKASFDKVLLKGKMFGNSLRSVIKNLSVHIPIAELNSANTKRDRTIYSYLFEKSKTIDIKIKELKRNLITLEIELNNVRREVQFKYDSRDISMQSIGYIDLRDFKLEDIKTVIEKQENIKIWNDIFVDVRAKFKKNCVNEL